MASLLRSLGGACALLLGVGLLVGLLPTPAGAQLLPGMGGGSARDTGSAGGDEASQGGAASTTSSGESPSDPLGRTTPRSSVRRFAAAARRGNLESASSYLDLRRIPEAERDAAGRRLARQLSEIFRHELWVDPDSLSARPEGASDDGLPPDRERVATLESGDDPEEILLARVEAEDGTRVWKVAPETVARIPALHRRYGQSRLEGWIERAPPWARETLVWGVELWQALALPLLALAAWGAAWLLARVLLRTLRLFARRSDGTAAERLLGVSAGPVRLLAGACLFWAGTLGLGFPLRVAGLLSDLCQLAAIFAAAWLGLRAVEMAARRALRRRAARGDGHAGELVALGEKAGKVLVLALAVVTVLHALGFDVTALMAGLGIGGVALALAAQRSLGDLFGGLTLYGDRPVAVGDFGRFGPWMGTVEDIGLRSTRIRTLGRTQVVIPNGEFAGMHLENLSRRDAIWYHHWLALRYETGARGMRRVLRDIRELLAEHPDVEDEPIRVRFRRFGTWALEIEVFCYVRTTDWDEFLEATEELHLQIMDRVEEAGAEFAFPSVRAYGGAEGSDGAGREPSRGEAPDGGGSPSSRRGLQS